MAAENPQRHSDRFSLQELGFSESGGASSLPGRGFRAHKLHLQLDEGGEASLQLLTVVSRDHVLSTMSSISCMSALRARPSRPHTP
jgi:hypothetical protein